MASLRDLLEQRTATLADLSPDGGTALVRSDLTGSMQLYLVPLAGGELRALTSFRDPVDGLFAPDGRVLLLRDEGGNERHQLWLLDAEPGAEPEPLVVEPAFLHRSPAFTRDGRVLVYGCNRRNGRDFDVWARELASGEERLLYAPGGWCEAAGISPDGRWVAVQRLTEKSGDNELVLVGLDGGEPIEVAPHDDEAVLGAPAWLPDSSAFHFACSVGRDTAAIARYELASGEWEVVVEDEWDLDCELDRSGRHLLVAANEHGASRLALHDPLTLERRAEVPLPGRGLAGPLRLTGDGRVLAYGFTAAREPGDVWTYDTETGASARLTESPGAVARDDLLEPRLHRYASFDGERVPVLLYERESDGPQPVVVYVHGGPESMVRPVYMPVLQYFASAGYAVAAPNVRGSLGYGKRYEHLDDVERRLDSVRDLVALRDWLVERGFDGERIVLYGGSYGGYMVLAGLAFHPELWAAGIDVVGISSLVTFLENTSEWRRSYREREYGSLERDRELLHRVSPLTHVDRIRAPLFLIHGRNDPRVPVSEAEQIHRLLAERGVPTELLVYDDEGHGLQKLDNKLDAYPRAVAFLERVLGRQADEDAA